MSSDNFETFVDLSDFAPVSVSPSLSSSSSKSPYARTTPNSTTVPQTIIPPSQPSLSGPSHPYNVYKQQTGMVPGAIADTMAINQANTQVSGAWDIGYSSGLTPDDSFDFNTIPSQGSMRTPDMDIEFDSPGAESFLFADSTINPTNIRSEETSVVPGNGSTPNTMGRMWPGIHQQQALAKAQAQQRQQQQLIQQQQQQRQAQQHQHQQHHAKPSSKSGQHSDPIVEQKITQLLNSMRAKPATSDASAPMLQLPRTKKEEDEMDEDERLLNSEEGKKLSSKERRQLRNKVSARAFRSRRKEYISQLESEIANKVAENGDLKAQNRALIEENRRLTDLTRMLLNSSSFSNFLDDLSSNPQAAVQPEPQRQAESQRQLPKDVNPYTSQQHINMTMIPEQSMDLSTISLNTTIPDGFNYQPQVFNAVLDTPDIDSSVLSGKLQSIISDEEQECKNFIALDTLDKQVTMEYKSIEFSESVAAEPELDEEDDTLELYRSSPAPFVTPHTTNNFSEEYEDSIFGCINSEKIFARYELVEPTEAESQTVAEEYAMLRLERVYSRLEASLKRLDLLAFD